MTVIRNPARCISGLVALGLAFAAATLQASSADGASRALPNSIVVLGHSGATGWNSDPAHPRLDAPQNSWATGTNPKVNSIYRRILARNPKIKGHNVNLAVSGSRVEDLLIQGEDALKLRPLPDLIVIQTLDNDIRCDGTDAANYGPFGRTLVKALSALADGAPAARIFLVSSPVATNREFAMTLAKIPGAAQSMSGTGPCDLFDTSGKPTPARWDSSQRMFDRYYAILAASCARFPACRYDRGALSHMQLEPGDLAPDYSHLSVAGLRKNAALEWKALGLP